MEQNTTLDILKEALLLEKRGKAFYEKVADQASNGDIKEFFTTMAQEEANHIRILSEQFKSFNDAGTFTWSEDEANRSAFASAVISDELKKEIGAADFEAAAISAAMTMEQKAIALYQGRADNTADEKEKALYAWLAKWENSHLNFLVGLDKDLREQIWLDNQFWPF